MRCPSKKRLVETFRITDSEANQIRALCVAVDDRVAFEEHVEKNYPEFFRRDNSSYYGKGNRVYILMQLCDKILSTHGVEHRYCNGKMVATYCNTGDSYAATLMQNVGADNLYIGSWATMAESGKAN